MKKTKFFWKELPLKADIQRHRDHETEIQAQIDKLEAIQNPTLMEVGRLKTYYNFMYQLQLSKAEVVSKIGKKK